MEASQAITQLAFGSQFSPADGSDLGQDQIRSPRGAHTRERDTDRRPHRRDELQRQQSSGRAVAVFGIIPLILLPHHAALFAHKTDVGCAGRCEARTKARLTAPGANIISSSVFHSSAPSTATDTIDKRHADSTSPPSVCGVAPPRRPGHTPPAHSHRTSPRRPSSFGLILTLSKGY
ncbi:hypothetical protein BDV93DRAFT_554559 [Ceratobasidium sp. AG-I]|nr:hypothetical protein BDV93DRAFT_554559 [Ceratobasidium sp. AG-I]